MLLALARPGCDYSSRLKGPTFYAATGTIAGCFTFPTLWVDADELLPVRVELWADTAKDVYLGSILVKWPTVSLIGGPIDPPDVP